MFYSNFGANRQSAIHTRNKWNKRPSATLPCIHLILIRVDVYLALRFNGHFRGGPGLAGTGMSPFWILLELRMMQVVATTGAITCKGSVCVTINKPTPSFCSCGSACGGYDAGPAINRSRVRLPGSAALPSSDPGQVVHTCPAPLKSRPHMAL